MASIIQNSARNDALEEAIRAIDSERVDADLTGEESDYAYNRAIDHAIQAIRALIR